MCLLYIVAMQAEQLITKGLAYIDSQDSATIALQKGTPTEAGKNSPYRNRSKEDNLFLFSEMKKGSFMEGEHVLRAKIDMASPNMHMRDPVLYRLMKTAHHRTNEKWIFCWKNNN